MTNCDNKIQAQSYSVDSLPSLDSLLTMCYLSDSLKLEADISEYSNTYRWNWWNVAPSIGYDFVYQRPIIMFNTSGIIQHFTNKRTVERKIVALESRSELSQQNNRVRITGLYNDLKNSILQLEMIKESFENYNKLHEIKVLQYQNNEINSEQYLKEEIAYNERKKVVILQIDKINQLFTSIELIVNKQLFVRIFYDTYLNDSSFGAAEPGNSE